MGSQLTQVAGSLTGQKSPHGQAGSFIDRQFLGGAQRDAAEQQARAGHAALATQKYIFNQTRKDAEPWRQSGLRALNQLNEQMPDLNKSFSMADYQADPGFDFRMAEGSKAIERSAAARGGLNSGATMKSLTRFAQGTASDEYGRAYDRFNNDRTNRFNKLSSLSGVGQVANSEMAVGGRNYGNQATQIQQGIGNARAGGIIGQYDAINHTMDQAAKYGAMMSDVNQKTNIAPAHDEISQILDGLRPYTFDYKEAAYGVTPQIGILAQDLEKTEFGRSIVQQTPNGKMIMVPQAVGALLAAVASLHTRVKQLEGKSWQS